MVDRARKGLIMANQSSPLSEALGSEHYDVFIALREEIRKAYEPIQKFCIENKRSFDYLIAEGPSCSTEAVMLGDDLISPVQKMTVFIVIHALGGVPLQSFQEMMPKLGFGVLPFVKKVASRTFFSDDHMKVLQEALTVVGQEIFSEYSASKK